MSQSSIALYSSKNSSSKKLISKKMMKSIAILTCGSFSGLISRLIISPFERVIILQQTNKAKKYLNPGQKQNFTAIVTSIFKKEGMSGVFKGTGLNLLRVVPLQAFEFFYYDLIQEFIVQKMFSNYSHPVQNLGAGCLAGAMAYTTVYPIDFSRTQQVTNKIPKNFSIFQSLIYVKKKYGFFNMFKGLQATWLSVVPYSGVKFVVFEQAKKLMLRRKKQKNLSDVENLIAGSLAGLVATTVTYPVEILRRRKQTHISTKFRKVTYKSIAQDVINKQGAKGFLQGLTTMYYKMIPLSALSFMLNEWSKKKIGLKQFQNFYISQCNFIQYFYFYISNGSLNFRIVKKKKNQQINIQKTTYKFQQLLFYKQITQTQKNFMETYTQYKC